jgi:hypothetical protein
MMPKGAKPIAALSRCKETGLYATGFQIERPKALALKLVVAFAVLKIDL